MKCAKKLSGLKKIGKFLSFKRRLITGKSVFLSRLIYGIEVWGPGVTFHQFKALQASLNRMANWITQNPFVTSVREDLNQCGLLSFNQLIVLKGVNCWSFSVEVW